jgi:hypothetical protein
MTRGAMRLIDRITNAPVVLVIKTLSATGATKAMTRGATRAIRRERLMRSSIILMSPLLVVLLSLVILGLVGAWKASTTGDAVIQALRSVVLLLTALSTLFFKFSKVRRTHHHGVAVRDRIRSRRSGQ